MKIFALIGLLVGSAFCAGGCETLAYSRQERDAMIARTWNIDFHEAVDDIDSALLLRPPSQLTIWHVR
jgi:hypothetical protein